MRKLADEEPEFVVRLEERGEIAVRADYDASRTYGGENRPKVARWLMEKDLERQAHELERADADRRLAERGVLANEAAAKAARDSADHAKSSAFWAKLSVLVALAALFVAAWPSFKIG